MCGPGEVRVLGFPVGVPYWVSWCFEKETQRKGKYCNRVGIHDQECVKLDATRTIKSPEKGRSTRRSKGEANGKSMRD